MTLFRFARFGLGQMVRHRDGAFSGVVVDVDAAYAGSGCESDAQQRDQPFYRVLPMGVDTGFLVYAAEAVLEPEPEAVALSDIEQARWFTVDSGGHRAPRSQPIH